MGPIYQYLEPKQDVSVLGLKGCFGGVLGKAVLGFSTLQILFQIRPYKDH